MMNDTLECLPDLKEKIASNALERQHLHDVTTLAAELKLLLTKRETLLKEEGVSKEMEQLEQWLETERKGPAPAAIISEGGITWLTALRDRLKLSADELQRLEGEGGGLCCTEEQDRKIEELLKTIRRMDTLIDHQPTKTH